MNKPAHAIAVALPLSLLLLMACDGRSKHAVAVDAVAPAATSGTTISGAQTGHQITTIAETPFAENSNVDCDKTEQGFGNFFNEFVKDDRIRTAHTAQIVEIIRFADESTRLGRETASEIEPFKIGLSDNMWSLITPDLADDDTPDRLELNFRPQGDHMRVDFIRGKYAPNDDLIQTYGLPGGYVFGHRDGCWQLMRELR